MSDGSTEDWFGVKPVLVLFEDENGQPVRLKSSNGYLQTVPGTVTPRDVYPLSSEVTVSTRTQLLAFTDLLSGYSKLLIGILNRDASNNVTLIIERSEDGTHEDAAELQLVAPPGESASIEIAEGFLHKYWALYGQSDNPYPNVNVQWWIRGIPRGGA